MRPNQTEYLNMSEPVKEYIDLDQHDNELLSINIDIETMEAVLKIKTFNWNGDINPPKNIKEEAKDNKCYRATFDKFIEIHLKLKYPKDSKIPMILCSIYPMQGEPILWCYISEGKFSLVCVISYIDAYIESYEIKEVK